MIQPTHYGAFNARWLSSEAVARSFVPVAQYLQLVNDGHSVLLGPRGCGKTTLLKMLTRRALAEWNASGRSERFKLNFKTPAFEAIFISSDVRWSYELKNLLDIGNFSERISLKAQRIMVTINTLAALLDAIELIVSDRISIESAIAERLIKAWKLKNTVRTLRDIRSSIGQIGSELRGYLNDLQTAELERTFLLVPPSFYGHPLDAPLDAISVVESCIEPDLKPVNWALCYDELEIAPEWLRTELLEALRSVKANVFLKLTWSPLLPSGLRTSPESAADFKAIRLWHSHIADPRGFCEELTSDFLKERFKDQSITPDQFFNRSILAAEANEEPVGSYEAGSTEYTAFKELASWDISFRRIMEARGIDPEDPVPKDTSEKDQFFRKVKPVVILRREFASNKRMQTRKSLAIYVGKEAVYSMCEGNPRWLRGLLNDFADLGDFDAKKITETSLIPYKDQARVLSTACQRFLALIRASPFKPPISASANKYKNNSLTLLKFVTQVGSYFRKDIYGKEFPVEPIGSFVVQEGTDEITLAVIEQLLELGALVFIGTSPQDTPFRIQGSRFRLSFILAPHFKTALRIFREVDLSLALREPDDHRQSHFEF